MFGVGAEGVECLNHILDILEQVVIHQYRYGPRPLLYSNLNISCPTIDHLMIFGVEVGVEFLADEFSPLIVLLNENLVFPLISRGSFLSWFRR